MRAVWITSVLVAAALGACASAPPASPPTGPSPSAQVTPPSAAADIVAQPSASPPGPARKPAPTPVVHEAAVTVVGGARRTFRGGTGTTEWTTVSISPDRVLAKWQATAGSKACSMSWRLDDGAGGVASGSVKAAAGQSGAASKTFGAAQMHDPSLTVKTTCRTFLLTLGAAASPKPAADTRSSCNPNYAGYCVPNVGYDLDCADVRHSVTVVGTDVYRLDGDGDGVGCESY